MVELVPQPSEAKLFLALWPSVTTLPAIEAWRDGATWPQRAQPIPSDHLHLTLHYIGAVPRERLAALMSLLAVPCPPVEIRLTHVEIWDNEVAVLVPRNVPGALSGLHATLAARLVAAGLPVSDRPYLPHVTLARKARGATFRTRPPVVLRCTEYVLAESDQGYRIVCRFGSR